MSLKVGLLALLFYCCLGAPTCWGQHNSASTFLRVEHIGTNEGLPDRKVNAIAQDLKGYIWILTRSGLFRYDGYSFLPAKELVQDDDLLFNIHRIFPSYREALYLSTPSELLELNTQKGTLSLHPITKAVQALGMSLNGSHLIEREDSTLILEAKGKEQTWLIAYKAGQEARAIDSIPTHGGSDYHTFSVFDKRLYWSNPNSVRIYDEDFTLIDTIKPDFIEHSETPSKNRLKVQPFDEKHIIIYSNTAPPQLYNRQDHTCSSLNLPKNNYNFSKKDRDGSVWFLGKNEFLKLSDDRKVHSFLSFLEKVADFNNFSGILEDNQGMLWVSTDNGIFKIAPPMEGFKNYFSNPDNRWGNSIRGFFEDEKGCIYFRCESCSLQPHKSIFRIYEDGSCSPLPLVVKDQALARINNARQFFPTDSAHIFWTQPNARFMMQLNLKQHLLVPYNIEYPENLAPEPPYLVHRQAKGKDGTIWTGPTLGSLLRYDTRSKTPEFIFQSSPAYSETVNIALLESSDGKLWMGSKKGLFCIDPKKGKVVRHFNEADFPGFSSLEVNCLHEDTDGAIWVGVFNNGLVKISQNHTIEKHYTTLNGLVNNTVAAILPQGKDRLWISTFNGLSCFNKSTEQFTNFHVDDGLSHNEFNFVSAFIDSKGRYYFGGMNGVNAFYPDQVLAWHHESTETPPLLTRMSYYDEYQDTLVIRNTGLSKKQKFEFAPDVNWFQLEFMLPDYTNPAGNRFQTFLEGFEKDWSAPTFAPYIRYNRLPAGRYTLKFRAAGAKGGWSPVEKIDIIVHQVFYKSWWFIALCVGTLVGLGYLLVRYRFRQKLKLERMRTQIASDLHDEVGSSLSYLNFLIGSFDMQHAPERTAAGIEKSKAVMKKTASNIRDVVWAIDARRDKAGDLLDRMEDFAYDMLSSRGLHYHLDISGIGRDLLLSPVFRQNIYLIYKEAINNIAKHSNADRVNITLRLANRQITLRIADNGHNQNHQKVKGQGLENMALRARRIRGELSAQPYASGFIVELQAPFG